MTLAQFYSPDEVAQRLAVSRRAVYEWIRQGRLKAYKAGTSVRIREDDVEAMLEAYTATDQDLDDVLKPDPHSDVLAAEAETEAESLTERIRTYVHANYIQPARMNDLAEIEISVTDIHRELKLQNRYPAVCNALERRFAERYGLKLISAEGPKQGAKTYHFALRG